MVTINYPGYPSVELPNFYPEFRGYYTDSEQETRRWMVDNVKPNWTCIDAGANIGIYSVLLSDLAYMGAVYAFEPTDTMDMLRKNIIYRGCGNVWLIQEALGSIAGQFREPIYKVWGQPPEEKEYHFNTIDKFMERDRDMDELHLLKIDVDSFEFDILLGAERTLSKFDPWVIVELNNALHLRNTNKDEVLEWLRSRGYMKHLILDGENYLLKRNM